jgi:hypothetical protein
MAEQPQLSVERRIYLNVGWLSINTLQGHPENKLRLTLAIQRYTNSIFRPTALNQRSLRGK